MGRIPRKRAIFAICLIFILLFTGTFAFIHLDHDCTGEDCLVCLQIEVARNVLKGLVLISFIALFVGREGCAKAVTSIGFSRALSPSLVSLKVQFTF